MTKEAWARWALLTGMAASYFGGIWAGMLDFPHGYDWRKNVISNLLSPRDNPAMYWAPAMGVAAAGLCMLPLAMWVVAELRRDEGGEGWARRLLGPAFFLGIGCLVLSAIIVPQHTHRVMGLRHAHELLARTAAVALGFGMICACLGVGAERRGLRAVWWGSTLVPIAGAIGSGILVALTRYGEVAGGAAQFFKGTVFWHLAFWEWAGSMAVLVFFLAGLISMGEREGKYEG